VQFSKFLVGPVVAFACVSLTSPPAASQTAAPSQPILKGWATPTNPTEAAAGGGRTKERDFQDCLDTWDKGTHMTKLEWRRSCERTIREYPELSQ
jgi:hypothetical protein